MASWGCFSRSLIELLKRGSPRTADAELRAYDEHDRLQEVAPADCADLAPTTHLSLNGSRDAGLWLGLNSAADLRPALVGTQMAGVVARLTRNWQMRPGPAADIMRLLADRRLADRHHWWPGYGQVCAARLVRAEQRRGVPRHGRPGHRPARATTSADLAGMLLEQLDKSPAYRSGRRTVPEGHACSRARETAPVRPGYHRPARPPRPGG